MQVGVITNPHSRKNRDRPAHVARLQAILGDLGEVHQTETVGSMKPILRDFLRKESRVWVADGGDGALHWVFRSGLEVLAEDEFVGGDVTMPMTIPTNGGTIDFIAQNLGIHGNAETLLAELRRVLESDVPMEYIEVDSMKIEGVCVTEDGEVPLQTVGFGVAAAGVGQRFFAKYYERDEASPAAIARILAAAFASIPVAYTPLRRLPGMPAVLRDYAREVFTPVKAHVTVDGVALPCDAYNGIHIASMPIDFMGVLKFFGQARPLGRLNALVGAMPGTGYLRNVPNMHFGREITGRHAYDRECEEMTITATGDELFDPVIDGEYYRNVREMTFSVGPRVRIPKLNVPKTRR